MHAAPGTPGADWPRIIPVVCLLIVGVNVTAAIFQERWDRSGDRWVMGDYTLAAGFVAGAVILLPFVVDAIVSFAKKDSEGMPLWLFPIPVALGVGYFMFNPAEVDVAPFALVFMSGEVVSRSRGKTAVAIFAGVISLLVVAAAQIFGPWEDGAFIWVIGIMFGWLGGFLIRELETKTAALEAAQADLAAKAAADERSRIAREVHDVIAHSLSVTMLHVTAARMALEKGDRSDDAIDSLREAEEQGRRSLTEIRRTVGLLGAEASSTEAPMPLANDLPELVSQFRNAGVDVSLQMRGDVDHLPAATGLGLYRIVQESLTNVAKHAPDAPAIVELDVGEADIELSISNGPSNGRTPARSDGAGLGLRGMAERAALLGGRLETTNGDGGWSVRLHVLLEGRG